MALYPRRAMSVYFLFVGKCPAGISTQQALHADSPAVITDDRLRPASILQAKSTCHPASTTSDISEVIFNHRCLVHLAAFNVRTPQQAGQQVALALTPNLFGIDVCLSETRIKEASTVTELTGLFRVILRFEVLRGPKRQEDFLVGVLKKRSGIIIIIDSMTSVSNTDDSLPYNHDLIESLIVKKRIKVQASYNHSEVPIAPYTHSRNLDGN
ncbi:hypothetical protein CLF_103573 [Clonorchis sinensis]|uniref:Uncharacterized protein n=1 Tax=Clonorchis sinensis TaxID=79923 RepID=H2KQA8_CLOSI|nr:hypothetical protein CLF_103573 [Clonorchis sinensis]